MREIRKELLRYGAVALFAAMGAYAGTKFAVKGMPVAQSISSDSEDRDWNGPEPATLMPAKLGLPL